MDPLPRAPEAPPSEQEQALRAKQQQLRMSYGLMFGGEHGKLILADLKHRFGWDGNIERSSYRPGMSHADMSFVEGSKEVVRHVLAMIEPLPEKPEPKPKTAVT